MFTHLTIIETNQCASLVQGNFDTHQSQFCSTLFITINPYHSLQLTKLGLKCILPHALLTDDDHLIGAQQVTKCLEEFENKNAAIVKKPFGESVLFENVFYAQFLLGHGMFLYLLAKRAKEKNPEIDSYLRLKQFTLPKESSPFLQNDESFAPLIESFFKITTVAFPEIFVPKKILPLPFSKKCFLKLASYLQVLNLKLSQNFLQGQIQVQPIMVYHHKLLYNWVYEKNQITPWLLKIGSDDNSWKKILSLILIPLWQNLFTKSFERWTEKKFGAKYSRIIDLCPLAFQNKSDQDCLCLQIERNNNFNFSLDGFTFDLQDKFKNGILKHTLKLEKCLSPLIPFFESEKFKEKTHFYNIDNTGLSGLLGHASFQFGVNSTLVTHGSHPKHDNPLLIKEFIRHGRGLFISRHKYTAIQSNIAQQFADSFIKNSQLIKTGPVAFGRTSGKIIAGTFKEKYFNDKDVLLYIHAGTYKPRHSFRFLIYETVDEYVANINDLIKNIEATNASSPAKKIKLVIKIRPTMYLNKQKLQELLMESPHYIIDETTPFLDLLQDCEGVISFSSTTLEEALLNKKSIFLLKRKNFSFFAQQDQLLLSKQQPTFFYQE